MGSVFTLQFPQLCWVYFFINNKKNAPPPAACSLRLLSSVKCPHFPQNNWPKSNWELFLIISLKFITFKQQNPLMEIHRNRTEGSLRRPSSGCVGGVQGHSGCWTNPDIHWSRGLAWVAKQHFFVSPLTQSWKVPSWLLKGLLCLNWHHTYQPCKVLGIYFWLSLLPLLGGRLLLLSSREQSILVLFCLFVWNGDSLLVVWKALVDELLWGSKFSRTPTPVMRRVSERTFGIYETEVSGSSEIQSWFINDPAVPHFRLIMIFETKHSNFSLKYQKAREGIQRQQSNQLMKSEKKKCLREWTERKCPALPLIL